MVQSGIHLTTTVSQMAATLAAGDVDNNNAVDPTDFGLFVSAYNSDMNVPGSGYDPNCDFTCDGLVDPTDFGVFVGNYNTIGDSLYTVALSFDATSLVGGGDIHGTFTFSGGQPSSDAETLTLDCLQTQAALYTGGAASTPLESHPTIAIPAYPDTAWSHTTPNGSDLYTYTTPFKITTSSVNYLTKITVYGTYMNARGSAIITLKPANFHVEDVSMTTLAGSPVQSVPKTHLVWDQLGSLASTLFPLTIRRSSGGVTTNVTTIQYNDVVDNVSPPVSYDDTLPATAFSAAQSSVLTYELLAAPASVSATPVKLGTDKVQLYQVQATGNQAVDSRLDLRYPGTAEEPFPYLDFQFGSRIYRGGLFAGHANDPSRLGRSFIRFPSVAGGFPSNTTFRVGDVNAYFTGALTTPNSDPTQPPAPVTLNVKCQQTQDAAWNSSQIVWSNAPTVDSNADDYDAWLTYIPATPNPQWAAWHMADEIKAALKAPTALSVLLHGDNDNDDGSNKANQWGYFAKKEFDAALAPCLLYALAFPVPTQVSPSGTFLAPIGNYSGTIAFNGIGIGDSVAVTLTFPGAWLLINNTPVGSPATVTITGFNNPYSFILVPTDATLDAYSHNPYVSLDITATCNGVSASGSMKFFHQ